MLSDALRVRPEVRSYSYQLTHLLCSILTPKTLTPVALSRVVGNLFTPELLLH